MYGVNRLESKTITMLNNNETKTITITLRLSNQLYTALKTAPINNVSEVIRRCIINSIERSPEAKKTGKKRI